MKHRIFSVVLLAFTACITTPSSEAPEGDPSEAPDDGTGERAVAVPLEPVEEDCGSAPVAEPDSCIDYGWQCGVVNAIGVATDVLGQIIPGCDVLDGIGMIGEACAAPDLSPGENAAIWACNVLSCLPLATQLLPHITAARAACAGGNILATAVRCGALADLCETERRNAQPICPGANPCPYTPSVGACDAGGGVRSDSDITRDCGRVVDGYHVAGPTHGSCMAACIGNTRDAGTSCWGNTDLDGPLPVCEAVFE